MKRELGFRGLRFRDNRDSHADADLHFCGSRVRFWFCCRDAEEHGRHVGDGLLASPPTATSSPSRSLHHTQMGFLLFGHHLSDSIGGKFLLVATSHYQPSSKRPGRLCVLPFLQLCLRSLKLLLFKSLACLKHSKAHLSVSTVQLAIDDQGGQLIVLDCGLDLLGVVGVLWKKHGTNSVRNNLITCVLILVINRLGPTTREIHGIR
mmetsp:Transcript_18623/g.27190  ORF Transcript_18623/g.27190 Transcript_18623/m.27190 type:complete len:206 (-) Transcript_18623:1211-1828(-)